MGDITTTWARRLLDDHNSDKPVKVRNDIVPGIAQEARTAFMQNKARRVARMALTMNRLELYNAISRKYLSRHNSDGTSCHVEIIDFSKDATKGAP